MENFASSPGSSRGAGRGRVVASGVAQAPPGQGRYIRLEDSAKYQTASHSYGAPPQHVLRSYAPIAGSVSPRVEDSRVVRIQDHHRAVDRVAASPPQYVLAHPETVSTSPAYVPVVMSSAVTHVSADSTVPGEGGHFVHVPGVASYASDPAVYHHGARAVPAESVRMPRSSGFNDGSQVVYVPASSPAIAVQSPRTVYVRSNYEVSALPTTQTYPSHSASSRSRLVPADSTIHVLGAEGATQIIERAGDSPYHTRYVPVHQPNVQLHGAIPQPAVVRQPSVPVVVHDSATYWNPVVSEPPKSGSNSPPSGSTTQGAVPMENTLRRPLEGGDTSFGSKASLQQQGMTRIIHRDITSSSVPQKVPQKRKKTCNVPSCEKYTQGGTKFCISHGGGRRCQYKGCGNSANSSTQFCISHGGGKRCNFPGCKTSARGNTKFCINHGGGRRCAVEECKKAALSFGNTCKEHGGGRRCAFFGCEKTPRSRTAFCVSHGGGKRCSFEGCSKSAVGKTDTCIQHGGGKRCEELGCTKSAILPGNRCVAHGGGRRCQEPGCTKAARSALQYCRRCATQRAKRRRNEPSSVRQELGNHSSSSHTSAYAKPGKGEIFEGSTGDSSSSQARDMKEARQVTVKRRKRA